jgi:hypothetical protein
VRGDVIWLVRGLVGTARTGVLRQTLPHASRRLYLLKGRVVSATSNRPGETLREVFSARWLLPLNALRSEAPDSEDAAGLSEAVLRREVPAAEVEELLRDHILAVGGTMLSSGQGGFSWAETRLLAPPWIFEGPGLERVFLAAAARDPEFEWARPLLMGTAAHLGRAPGLRRSDLPSGLSFAAACKTAGGGEDAARRIWGLLLLGRLHLGPPKEAGEEDPDTAALCEEEQIARRLMKRGISNRAAEDGAYALRHEKPRA